MLFGIRGLLTEGLGLGMVISKLAGLCLVFKLTALRFQTLAPEPTPCWKVGKSAICHFQATAQVKRKVAQSPALSVEDVSD